MRTTAHPPVAAGDIEKLRSALVAALGAEAVTDDADALVEFRDPYWVQMRTNERIKDAVDPNGILSPGKQGIWPARMRA